MDGLPDDKAEIARVFAEYQALLHGVQTGIGYRLEHDKRLADPKHLRTGIDSAMVSDAAIVKLLIDKGVFTELEFVTALRDKAQEEVARNEAELQVRFGANIKLR